MSAKSEVFWRLKTAQAQATSFLHRDKPSGLRYEGEAEGLLFALRAIAAEQREQSKAVSP